MSLGARIKEARLLRGLTQEGLGKIVGTTKTAIANYENEVSSPREETLIRLFAALNVEPNYLYQDYLQPESTLPTIKVEVQAEEYDVIIAYRKAKEHVREWIRNLLGVKATTQPQVREDDTYNAGKKVVDIVTQAYLQKEGTDNPQE